MKSVFLSAMLIFSTISGFSQVFFQGGAGFSTSGFFHPVTEVEAGRMFEKDGRFQYQASGGLIVNFIEGLSVPNIKAGVIVDDKWTFKAGVGSVNGNYSILILGAEGYIKSFERKTHKVYYGVDVIDGNFHAKLGVRFNHKLKSK